MRKRQRKKNDRKRRVHPFSWAAAGIELYNSVVKTWLNNPESRCYQHCVDNAVVVRRGTGNRIDVEMTVPVFVPDEVDAMPIDEWVEQNRVLPAVEERWSDRNMPFHMHVSETDEQAKRRASELIIAQGLTFHDGSDDE